mgnify:CR=1 FL=1
MIKPSVLVLDKHVNLCCLPLLQFLWEIQKHLDFHLKKAQHSNNHISTFYYYRAILHLYRNDFNKAVADVDKAIEKC